MAEEEIDLDTGTRRIIEDDPPPPPRRDEAKKKRHPPFPPRRPKDSRTLVRQRLTPYLPPPVVKAIGNIDPVLEPYVGPEACITIASSLLLCFLIFQMMKLLAAAGGGGKAIADDDDDDPSLLLSAALNQVDEFGDTVIFCGPMWAGKTRIFYHLVHGDASLPTVMSLRANAALLPTTILLGTEEETSPNNKPLRVLDYPGHSGLQDSLFLEMLQSSLKAAGTTPARIVLVVDSTQPLASAADFLYDLLQHAKDMNQKLDVFVACHKSDLSTSKNPRRIKISLRTELEKLIKVRSTKVAAAAQEDDEGTATTMDSWWKEGETLDLDELEYARLRFEATTCNVGDGIDKLAEFCKTGAME